MRLLMVAMQYPVEVGESYLTTELAEALIAAGHEVEVLHLDWHGASPAQGEELRSPTGVRVVRCAPPSWGRPGSLLWKAAKFVGGGRRLAWVAQRHFDLGSFDAALMWMPAVAIAPLLPLLARAQVAHRLLFIWDFFPDHYHEIGRIPGGLPLWVARMWERRLIGQFSAIVCSLDQNAAYLRAHYPVRRDQQVLVTPVWGNVSIPPPVDTAGVRRKHGLPRQVPIAVFGGQLVAGRGFEQMLDAARAGHALGSPMHFLFIGEGDHAVMIRAAAERTPNVLWRPAVARDDYLALVGACDLGMVATVPGVRSFSFPSKLIDYWRAGVPVVAAIEHGNALHDLIETRGLGRCVPFGDAIAFLRAAEALVSQHKRAMRDAARVCLDEVFDVRHAVATVEAAVAPRGVKSDGTQASAVIRHDTG